MYGFAYFFVPATKNTDKQKAQGILFLENRLLLSQKDFLDQLEKQLSYFHPSFHKNEKVFDVLSKQIIQRALFKALVLDMVREKTLAISSDQLEEKKKEVEKNYKEISDLKTILQLLKKDYSSWKKSTEDALLKEKLIQTAFPIKKTIKNSELLREYRRNPKAFYQQDKVFIQQIVLKRESDALRIRQQILKGANIKELANTYSIFPQRDGHLGWVARNTLDVYDFAFLLAPGKISPVKKSPYGYHILKVIKKRPQKKISFLQAKPKIKAEILKKRRLLALKKALQRHLDKKKLRINKALLTKIKKGA